MLAKVVWFPAGCLLAVAGYAGFLCWFGWEAVETGANVTGWLSLFIPGVVLPLAGSAFCLYMAAGSNPARGTRRK